MRIKILQKRNVKSKPVVVLYRSRTANKKDLGMYPSAISDKKITEFINTTTLAHGVCISDVIEENQKYLLVKGIAKQKSRVNRRYGNSSQTTLIPKSYYKGAEAYWDDDDLYIVTYAINNNWEYPLTCQRHWIEESRLLFNKNKEALCQKYQSCYENNFVENKRSFIKATKKQTKQFFDNLECCQTSVNGTIENDMSLFFNEVTSSDKLHHLHLVGGNRIIAIDSIENLFEYFNYSEPKRKNSKEQEEIDYFNQFPLNEKIELTEQLEKSLKSMFLTAEKNYYYNPIMKFSILEKVPCEKQCNCLRMFGYLKSGYMREVSRFYITKEKIIPARIHYNKQWIKAHTSSGIREYEIALGDIDEDLCKGTKLEYISSILKNFDVTVRGTALYIFLYENLFEMLYKIPENQDDKLLELNKYLIKNSCLKYRSSIALADILKNAIGTYSDKGNIFKRIRLNSYQFKQMANVIKNQNDTFRFFIDHNHNINEHLSLFSNFKSLFEIRRGNNIELVFNNSDLCNADTDKLIETIVLLHKRTFEDLKYLQSKNIRFEINYISYFTAIFSSVLNIWGIKTAMNFTEQLVSLILKSKELAQMNSNRRLNKAINDTYRIRDFKELTYLRDYLNIVTNLKNMNQSISLFNPYFKGKTWEQTFENIKRMHDEVTILYNSIKDEVNKEQFDNSVKKCDKWIYDNKDYQWIVQRPEDPSEIATEGIQLKHCVKGFIPNVTNGDTNILFIRKRNEGDKPFFTVEVTNEAKIRQVHGFNNKTMFEESEEFVDFVKVWCKHKKIQYQKGTGLLMAH